MTGYGNARCQLENKSIRIEVRSLNNKNIDLHFRIPQAYKEKEPVFRNLASQYLERGKTDVTIKIDCSEDYTNYILNKTIFKKYYRELKNLSDELKANDNENLISAILNLPDVLIAQEEEISDDEWIALEECFKEALEKTDKYRQSEGLHIKNDLLQRINKIYDLLGQIEPYEQQRIKNIKKKLQNSLSEINTEYDSNRLEQELIYYLEKLDINEEKVRLEKHIDYFNEILNDKNSSNGKKLGFITQEIGREINTLGSKASEADIQKIVVQMKDELEKIKEQLSNIL